MYNSKGEYKQAFSLGLGKNRTRSHGLRVKGKIFHGNMRGKLFTQRMLVVWNELPAQIDVGSISTLKNNLVHEWEGYEGLLSRHWSMGLGRLIVWYRVDGPNGLLHDVVSLCLSSARKGDQGQSRVKQ